MHHVHHALSSATIVVLMHAPMTLAIVRVSRHRLCLLYDELEQRRHNHAHAFLVRCVVFSYYSHKIDGKYDAAAFKYYGISVKKPCSRFALGVDLFAGIGISKKGRHRKEQGQRETEENSEASCCFSDLFSF
jgi:hypothetical protein